MSLSEDELEQIVAVIDGAVQAKDASLQEKVDWLMEALAAQQTLITELFRVLDRTEAMRIHRLIQSFSSSRNQSSD